MKLLVTLVSCDFKVTVFSYRVITTMKLHILDIHTFAVQETKFELNCFRKIVMKVSVITGLQVAIKSQIQ
jgi:hypothetical protein